MPEVRARRTFEGRMGIIPQGTVFTADEGYIRQLKKNNLVEDFNRSNYLLEEEGADDPDRKKKEDEDPPRRQAHEEAPRRGEAPAEGEAGNEASGQPAAKQEDTPGSLHARSALDSRPAAGPVTTASALRRGRPSKK